MIVNSQGYVCRGKTPKSQPGRNWFLIKDNCQLDFRRISFKRSFIGKKVRLKVEVIE
jgi:hypothetical protein